MDKHADIIDEAFEITNRYNEAAVKVHRDQQAVKRLKPSEYYCLECDEPIPQARRDFGGIEYCVDCATEKEKRQAYYR